MPVPNDHLQRIISVRDPPASREIDLEEHARWYRWINNARCGQHAPRSEMTRYPAEEKTASGQAERDDVISSLRQL